MPQSFMLMDVSFHNYIPNVFQVPFGAPKQVISSDTFCEGAPIGAPKLLTRWYKQWRIRSQWIWVTQFFSQPSAVMPLTCLRCFQPQHRTYMPTNPCTKTFDALRGRYEFALKSVANNPNCDQRYSPMLKMLFFVGIYSKQGSRENSRGRNLSQLLSLDLRLATLKLLTPNLVANEVLVHFNHIY